MVNIPAFAKLQNVGSKTSTQRAINNKTSKMKNLIKLKHWQIFGLIIVIPPLLIILGSTLFKMTEIKFLNSIFPLIAALTMAITYYGWIWSITVNLYKYVSVDIHFDLDKFKNYFRLSLIIFLVITPLVKMFLGPNSGLISSMLGLASISLFFYCIYLTSTITHCIIQKNSKKTFHPIIDFILVWLLPIGIWIIQPNINQFLSDQLE